MCRLMELLEAEGPPVNFDLWDLPETGDDFDPDITIDPNGRRQDTTDRQSKPGKPSPSGGPYGGWRGLFKIHQEG